MKSVLIVDDDPLMRNALKEAVTKIGYQSVLAQNGPEAISKMDKEEFAAVVTDMNMPQMNGLQLMKRLREFDTNLPVLVITGYGTVENAVESMKEGAYDYLMKPFSFEKLQEALEKIVRIDIDSEILTGDGAMLDLIRVAGDIAYSDTTVLIAGESGTGKELFARYIHKRSRRKDGPFVAVNCAAIPENLLESEMFGHEKGSFSGALDRKIGKFELAHSGTILLDEIGEMPISLQAKLLRVLQEKEVDRIGGRAPVKVDIRVISTTNRNLVKEIEQGRFREDLFYRLSVFPLEVPPLRERGDDVRLLAEHFVKKFSGQMHRPAQHIDEHALEILKSRRWRGNVRELENVIQRAVVLCRGEKVAAVDITPEASDTSNPATGTIRDMEMAMIFRALKETKGNKSLAARKLGITVRTLRNKLNEQGKNFPEE
jgi:two-component system response regulator FlrC